MNKKVLYRFRLEIRNGLSIAEIAGELWTVAKNLREGTLKQVYRSNVKPLAVNWEVDEEDLDQSGETEEPEMEEEGPPPKKMKSKEERLVEAIESESLRVQNFNRNSKKSSS